MGSGYIIHEKCCIKYVFLCTFCAGLLYALAITIVQKICFLVSCVKDCYTLWRIMCVFLCIFCAGLIYALAIKVVNKYVFLYVL